MTLSETLTNEGYFFTYYASRTLDSNTAGSLIKITQSQSVEGSNVLFVDMRATLKSLRHCQCVIFPRKYRVQGINRPFRSVATWWQREVGQEC